jgi:REP element-mobilizing transposase RayT
MRGRYTELYLHLVWGTWQREPLITPDLQRDLYASLAHHSAELGADVIAIGGMPDHVHLLVRFPTTISVSEFVRRVKGGSSHLVTQVMRWPEPFKWQGGYGAFSVSKRNLAAAQAYVLNQERHHAEGTALPTFERTLR